VNTFGIGERGITASPHGSLGPGIKRKCVFDINFGNSNKRSHKLSNDSIIIIIFIFIFFILFFF